MDKRETPIEHGDGDELSWPELRRMALFPLGVAVLAPAGVTLLLAVGFVLLPAALAALPFVLPGWVADGAAEREHKREHDALPLHGQSQGA